MSTKKCTHCGAEIAENATRCYACKAWVEEPLIAFDESKPREFLPTVLLAMFLGQFGVHRFYTGNYAIGIVQLLTLGGCGIWSFIDFIMICFNNFRDRQGRLLTNYDRNIGIVLFIVILIPFVIILFLILGIIMAITLPYMLRG